MDDATTGGVPAPDAVPPPAGMSGPTEPPTSERSTIRCDQCGEDVPDLAWCVRCGDPLGPEQRRGREGRIRDSYAAMPGERASAVRVVSTLFPALPREEIRTFQIALLGGSLLVVALALLGLFPVAIVAAAILVPLITIIYLYDVDVYEDEPIRVILLTFIWGALVGVLFSYTLDILAPTHAVSIIGGGSVFSGGGTPFPWLRGVVAPILAVFLMAAGPLVLLPHKRFNDVLDGATFGVASGVAFVGAQTLVTALDLFDSGLRPVGDVVPWVVRLLVLGVAMPLVAAGAIGGVCGACWLRYRAPVADRGAMGLVGRPVVAVAIAAGLLLAASLSQLLLPEIGTLVVAVMLAVAALLWLRRVIHVGLLQEADEIAIGPEITCPECGRETPRHTYCGNCGASLKALPKTRGVAAGAALAGGVAVPDQATEVAAQGGEAITTSPSPARHGWLGSGAVLVLFAVIMLGAVAIAAASAYVTSQGHDQPDCPDKSQPCAGSAQGSTDTLALAIGDGGAAYAPFADRTKYQDDALGFSLEFDPNIWTISKQNDGLLSLAAFGGAVGLIIQGAPADRFDTQGLFDAGQDWLKGLMLGFTADDDQARKLLGHPILGYHQGVGGLFGGTVDTPQGPSTVLSVASVASTDGLITVMATMVAPVDLRDAGLSLADSVVNSFTWPADEVVQ